VTATEGDIRAGTDANEAECQAYLLRTITPCCGPGSGTTWSRTVRSTRLGTSSGEETLQELRNGQWDPRHPRHQLCRIAVASTSCGISLGPPQYSGSRDEWLFPRTYAIKRAAGRGVRYLAKDQGARGIHAGCSYRTRRASFRKRHTDEMLVSASMSRPISPCTLHFHSASSRLCKACRGSQRLGDSPGAFHKASDRQHLPGAGPRKMNLDTMRT